MRHPSFATLASAHHGTMVLVAVAMFALGVIADCGLRSATRGGGPAEAVLPVQKTGVR